MKSGDKFFATQVSLVEEKIQTLNEYEELQMNVPEERKAFRTDHIESAIRKHEEELDDLLDEWIQYRKTRNRPMWKKILLLP